MIRWGTACAATCLPLLALLGCISTGKKPNHPDDPLLLTKKPVEGSFFATPQNLVARAEPVPPASPVIPQPTRMAQDLPPPTAPLPDSPMLTRPAPPRRQAFPASRRRVSGTFGHAEDFSWLQGVLTRTATGTLHLRYLAPTPEQDGLGLVALDDDPRLGAFRPGDVVLVEGDAQEQPSTRLYRVRSVWLVKRGE